MKKACLSVVFALVGSVVTSASDFASPVAEATFKITNVTFTATCFFVRRAPSDSSRYLVTSAHFLETKDPTATVALRERREDGSYQRRDYTIALCREGKPLWVRHATEDAAVLRLTEAPPVPITALPFSALGDETKLSAVPLCSSVFVLTYPAGLEWNEAVFPIARHGIIASHPLTPVDKYRTFLADFASFHGDSGAPLFLPDAKGEPLVIGMVIGELRRDESPSMEYEERVIHHQVGLGIAIHTQFIRELIEQADKKAATDSLKKP